MPKKSRNNYFLIYLSSQVPKQSESVGLPVAEEVTKPSIKPEPATHTSSIPCPVTPAPPQIDKTVVDANTLATIEAAKAAAQFAEEHIAARAREALYRDERKVLIDSEQKSADQHDKAILTLAAGGLAISITFLEKIAPNPYSNTLFLLALSWSGFIFSLITILASFLTSQHACARQIEICGEEFCKPDEAIDDKNSFRDWTRGLNIASYVLFVIGVFFLACFTYSNIHTKQLEEDQSMADKHNKPFLGIDAGKEKRAGHVPPVKPAIKPVLPTKPGIEKKQPPIQPKTLPTTPSKKE